MDTLKGTYAKRFDRTGDCIAHPERQVFVAIARRRPSRGATTSGSTRTITRRTASAPSGSATRGVSAVAIAQSAILVSASMCGMIDGPNLRPGAGIVLCEVTKQRRACTSVFRRTRRRAKPDEPSPTVMLRDDGAADVGRDAEPGS